MPLGERITLLGGNTRTSIDTSDVQRRACGLVVFEVVLNLLTVLCAFWVPISVGILISNYNFGMPYAVNDSLNTHPGCGPMSHAREDDFIAAQYECWYRTCPEDVTDQCDTDKIVIASLVGASMWLTLIALPALLIIIGIFAANTNMVMNSCLSIVFILRICYVGGESPIVCEDANYRRYMVSLFYLAAMIVAIVSGATISQYGGEYKWISGPVSVCDTISDCQGYVRAYRSTQGALITFMIVSILNALRALIFRLCMATARVTVSREHSFFFAVEQA